MKKIIVLLFIVLISGSNLLSAEAEKINKLPESPVNKGIRGAANFIVAKIDEEVILMSDLRREYEQWKYYLRKMKRNIPDFNFKTKKQVLRERLMEEIFFLIYAKKNQIEVSEAQINKRIYDIKNNYKIESDEELVVATNRSGMMGKIENINQLRDYFRRMMLIMKAKNHLVREKFRNKLVAPTTQQLKSFYNNNPKYFYGPPQVKLQHLVIKVNENADFEELEKLEKKLKTIKSKAKQGTNFSKLVNEYADPTYRSNNGYISKQYLGRNELRSLFPKYVKFAFSAKQGSVSDVIVDGNKRIILKVSGKKEKQLKPFDEVKNQVKQYLLSQQGQKLIDEWVKKQMRVRLIKVYYDRLRVSE